MYASFKGSKNWIRSEKITEAAELKRKKKKKADYDQNQCLILHEQRYILKKKKKRGIF